MSMNIFNSLIRGSAQGATFGTSDEITSGIGALLAKLSQPDLFRDKKLNQMYADALQEDRQKNQQAREDNPKTYAMSELLSGLALPVGAGSNGLKSALKTGAGYGMLSGAGYSESNNPYGVMRDTAVGGILGLGAGAAIHGAGMLAKNPQVQQSVKNFVADESGALKIFPSSDTMKLYRGLTKEYDPSYSLASTDAPIGYSTWTDNPELAKQYAGEKGFVYQIDLPKNKKGIEMIDKDGERYLFLNNQKKAGLNKVSGDEYLVYNYHDDFSPNLIKRYLDKGK